MKKSEIVTLEHFGFENGILTFGLTQITLLVEQVIDLQYLTMTIVTLRYIVMIIRLVEGDDNQTSGK